MEGAQGMVKAQMKTRLHYLLSHPIQYQSPFLSELAQDKEIDLKVFYEKSYSNQTFFDPNFNTLIQWDIPLLQGYSSSFIESIVSKVSFLAKLSPKYCDILWVHGYARIFQLLAISIAHLRGVRVMVRSENWEKSKLRSKWQTMLLPIIFLFLRNFIDVFLFIGTRNKHYYQRYGVCDDKLVFAPYVVDNNFFSNSHNDSNTEKIFFDNNHSIKLLYCGKLMARKGIEDLLRALTTVAPRISHPVHLVVAGAGPLEPHLKTWMQSNTNIKTTLLGFQNQHSLQKVYAGSDILVVPSRIEPWGLVINEGMAAGLPIVTSQQVGASVDLVSENNGWVYDAETANGLADVLYLALSSKEVLAQKGLESRRKIRDWSFQQLHNGIQQGIARCLSQK